MDFDIEDFLKMDSDGFNGLGLGPTETDETSRGSKSSRWFSKSQEQAETSNPPSVPEKGAQQQQSKQDAARSLLEMLQKGTQQPQDLKKILTAEELERSTGKCFPHELLILLLLLLLCFVLFLSTYLFIIHLIGFMADKNCKYYFLFLVTFNQFVSC